MVPLIPEDYYRFNAPFRIWLSEVKGKQLGDFKTEEAKVIFAVEFLPDWNESKLPKEFYLKGPEIKPRDLKGPFKIIRSRTDKPDAASKANDSFGFSKQEESKLFSHKLPKSDHPQHPQSSLRGPVDKSHLKRRAEDLDELAPKKEGHAKLIEDRRTKSAYTRMERNNPHDLELPDDQLFSGSTGPSRRSAGTDDYNTLLRLEREKAARRERERSGRKEEKDRELQGKIDKYNQREQEVQEILKKMVNKR